jgi:hypothetical protein
MLARDAEHGVAREAAQQHQEPRAEGIGTLELNRV